MQGRGRLGALIGDDIDLAGAALGATDDPFGFQGAQVPGHPVGAPDAEVPLDLGDGRRAAVFAPKCDDVIIDLTLSISESHGISIYTFQPGCQEMFLAFLLAAQISACVPMRWAWSDTGSLNMLDGSAITLSRRSG